MHRFTLTGFGSAGVEIIRQNLLKGSSTRLALNQSGSTVNCIFLFCDILQFTDATEALQEEVFVFTNRIAHVVHSICHAYGGSANKNVGDAFLVSWRLREARERATSSVSDDSKRNIHGSGAEATMPTLQADKALYSVIKIRLALYNDSFFLEPLGASAKERLLEKLKGRKGPAVQVSLLSFCFIGPLTCHLVTTYFDAEKLLFLLRYRWALDYMQAKLSRAPLDLKGRLTPPIFLNRSSDPKCWNL